MEKEFVPYQEAFKLKELGFNELCGYYVDKDNESYIYNFESHPDEFIEWCGVNVIPTPTFSQAFRWFREKYGFLSYVDMDNYSFYRYTIYKGKGISEAPYKTYEEAELACLIKLIEIVKERQ